MFEQELILVDTISLNSDLHSHRFPNNIRYIPVDSIPVHSISIGTFAGAATDLGEGHANIL